MTARGRRFWKAGVLTAVGAVLAGVVGLSLLLRSQRFNEFIDRRGIAMMADVAARGGPEGGQTGTTGNTLPYLTATELEVLTRPPAAPLSPASTPMRRYRLTDASLTQEVLTFDSAIRLSHADSNIARAYVYRRGPLGARPVVLWVPGQYTTDLAMVPISWLFQKAIARGADVVMLVPPYHLERSPAGFASGDAVLATSLPDHLNTFAQELSDLRRLVRWLRAQGVQTIGGFGGSAGAMALLRITTWERSLDFLTLFNPMLRIGDVLNRPDSAAARRRLERDGYRIGDVQKIYASLDATGDKPTIAPGRLSVLYGRFDQLALESTTRDWTSHWGIARVVAHACGHSLALLERQMYPDYAALLNEDLQAFGR